jgi:hypothetical protein
MGVSIECKSDVSEKAVRLHHWQRESLASRRIALVPGIALHANEACFPWLSAVSMKMAPEFVGKKSGMSNVNIFP